MTEQSVRLLGGFVREEYNRGNADSGSRPCEGRGKTRILCVRPVLLRTLDNREILANCTDLNSTGIGLETERVLAVGQRVQLTLDEETVIPLLVIYRMGKHYGLSALAFGERLMELLPVQ